MTTSTIAAIVIAVCTGGGLTAVVNWFTSRRKMGADAVKVYTDTTLLLLKPMREEIERLESRVQKVNEQLTIAGTLLRANQIEWPAGSTPPPWV
jgi:hypothetical protein